MPKHQEVKEARPRRPTDPTPFTVFDTNRDTDNIVRSGTTQYGALWDQPTEPGQAVVEGEWDDSLFDIRIGPDGWSAVPKQQIVAATADMVDAETDRRITDRFRLVDQINALRGDGAVDWTWIDAMRSAGRQLKSTTPIPLDFTDDKYWTGDSNG